MKGEERFEKDWRALWKKLEEDEGYLDLPDSFDYVPTLRCNLRCPGCFQDKLRFKKDDELTLDEFKQMVDNLKLEGKIFKLIGGEIFVRQDIPEMFDYLTRSGAHIIFGTNGLRTPDPKDFSKWNILELTASIDGLGQKHDEMRGIFGTFKNVRDFIYDMGIYGYGHRVHTTTMLYDSNLEDIPEVAKLKDRLGITAMRFQIPKWSSLEEIEETKKILGEDTILDVSTYPYKYTKSKLSSILYSSFPLNGDYDSYNGYYVQPDYYRLYPKETLKKQIRKRHKCACKYLFRGKINPNGDVNPCFYILTKMGNIKEQSFEEIWNSPKYREFRRKMVENNLVPICENCCSMEIIG